MIWRNILNFNQAEDGAGAGGSSGSAGAGVAENAAGAAPAAGDAGNGGQPPADEQTEYDLGEQKVKLSKAQLIDELRKATDYTKKTQSVAAMRKEYAQKIMRADEILKEMQANGGRKPAAEQPDPEKLEVDPLRAEVEQLKSERLIEKWEKVYNPVKAKFPDVNEKDLVDKFTEAVRAGDVDDNEAGLAEVAGNLAKEAETGLNSRLDKLLADDTNPKIAALKKKAVEDYLAGKLKLNNSGGDNGKGPTGGAPNKKESISEIAERLRNEA